MLGIVYGTASPSERSWMKFDVSCIPPGAVPTKIVVHFYVTTITKSFSGLRSRFYKIDVDPVTALPSEMYLNGLSAIYVQTGIAVSSTGWKSFQFSSGALSTFNTTYLPLGYVAINLYAC
jgi:hypothetical protein